MLSITLSIHKKNIWEKLLWKIPKAECLGHFGGGIPLLSPTFWGGLFPEEKVAFPPARAPRCPSNHVGGGEGSSGSHRGNSG